MSLKALNQTFKNDSHGFIAMHKLEQIHTSNLQIKKIAEKYGYQPIYKPNSKKIHGYGNYTYSHLWLKSSSI